MLHSDRYYSDGHPITLLVRGAVLCYVAIVLLLHLAAVAQYLNSISSSAALARMSIYAGFLGPFSVFLGVLLWDTVRNGGVRIMRIFSSVGLILGPLALITILALAFNFHPTAYWGEHGDSRLLPFFPLFSFLYGCFGASFVVISGVVRHYRGIFILCIVFLFFSQLLDFLSLDALTQYEGRAAGFASNPNFSAQLLLALTIASVDWRRASLLNNLIWLVAGVGVFLTLSRGGLLEYVLALCVYLVVTTRAQARTLLSQLVLVAILILTLVFGLPLLTPFLESNEMMTSPTAQKKLEQLNALLTGNLESVASDDRAWVAYEWVDRITQSPWLGHGTGFVSTTLGPHNIYLNQWVENGVLGLALLLVFIFASFWHFKRYKDLRGVMYVATWCVAGFFSHNLLQPQPFLFLWGFLGALAYVERRRPNPPHPSLPRA